MAGIFTIIDIGASGLSAQRTKLNAVAQNIANVETTKTPEGTPYKRRRVTFEEDQTNKRFIDILDNSVTELSRTHVKHFGNTGNSGTKEGQLELVSANEQIIDPPAFKMIYDPTHPDADENGYVQMPDIDIVTEMVDMMSSSRAYEADVSVVQSAKEMAMQALDI
jgi:flagellar basal-body rod protein FlgC